MGKEPKKQSAKRCAFLRQKGKKIPAFSVGTNTAKAGCLLFSALSLYHTFFKKSSQYFPNLLKPVLNNS